MLVMLWSYYIMILLSGVLVPHPYTPYANSKLGKLVYEIDTINLN